MKATQNVLFSVFHFLLSSFWGDDPGPGCFTHKELIAEWIEVLQKAFVDGVELVSSSLEPLNNRVGLCTLTATRVRLFWLSSFLCLPFPSLPSRSLPLPSHFAARSSGGGLLVQEP